MTLRLMFNQENISRATTREQWRAMWRWKRVAESAISIELARHAEMLATYGTTHPEIYKTAAEELVNPPLLVRE